jgi:hypothetical protein
MAVHLLVAVVIVALVAWGGGVFYRRMRDRADRAEEGSDSEREVITREFALPSAPAPGQFATLGVEARRADWRKRFHEPAIAHKNRYYEFLGRCGFLIAAIFIQMALSLTVLPPRTGSTPILPPSI